MDITEKVAYLKGLVEGLGYNKTTNEGKVILAIVDVLDEIALTVSDLEDGMELMSEQIDEIDEDFAEMHDDYYDDDEDEDYLDEEIYEVTCPTCGSTICVDEDMLDEGEISCPSCNETLEFDFDGLLDECECGCDECGGHHHEHE